MPARMANSRPLERLRPKLAPEPIAQYGGGMAIVPSHCDCSCAPTLLDPIGARITRRARTQQSNQVLPRFLFGGRRESDIPACFAALAERTLDYAVRKGHSLDQQQHDKHDDDDELAQPHEDHRDLREYSPQFESGVAISAPPCPDTPYAQQHDVGSDEEACDRHREVVWNESYREQADKDEREQRETRRASRFSQVRSDPACRSLRSPRNEHPRMAQYLYALRAASNTVGCRFVRWGQLGNSDFRRRYFASGSYPSSAVDLLDPAPACVVTPKQRLPNT